MEKPPYPEHVHVGNDLLVVKSFSALSSPKMPNWTFAPGGRNPLPEFELDFADVFGGPPRMAKEPTSTNMEQNCRNDIGEKPVFGEERRRGIITKDFFDDIYGGKSLPDAQMKRKSEKKVAFYSVPVSRTLSPTCGSPSRVAPWSPSPSVYSRIRQFPGLGKGSESPVSITSESGIPSSPGLSVLSLKEQAYAHGCNTRFSVQSVEEQQDFVSDSRLPYRQSRLSHQYSLSNEHPLKIAGSSGRRSESDIGTIPSHLNDGPKSLHSRNHFHFSIHKWAGKGATLLMPLKRRDGSKEQNSKDAKSSGTHKTVFEGVGIHSDEKSFVASSFQGHCITTPHYLHSNRKNPCDVSISELPRSIDTRSPCPEELSEFRTGHLPCLRENASEESGMDENAERKKGLVHKKIQTIIVNDGGNMKSGSRLEGSEASRPVVGTMEPSSEARLRGNRVKGKVKEFIKLFNQEGYQKPKSKVDNKDEKTGRKAMNSSYIEAHHTTSSAPRRPEETGDSGRATSTGKLLKIHQILKQEDDNEFDMQFSVPESRSLKENDVSDTCAVQTSSQVVHDQRVKSTGHNFHRNFSVEPSSDNHKHQNLTAETQVEVQSLDIKIKKWADGKEGNIRSLLSTLQYILGTESGWKPVPLVDIIEGTAVKRSYQKALLCLHPDKLQQRGVTVHQKYISEKVFDILQEAWTKYSDITSV